MRLILALCLAADMAGAECPAPPDVSEALGGLIDKARAAETREAGRAVAGEMWELLLRAPDPEAQALLDRGLRRREALDFAGALADFSALTAYCPLYAEGFNQRAFVLYLTGGFTAALTDLDRALALQPLHVGAQSGRGLTLLQLGRIAEARAQMREAVANNPWLSEAALLEDGAPLGPEGERL